MDISRFYGSPPYVCAHYRYRLTGRFKHATIADSYPLARFCEPANALETQQKMSVLLLRMKTKIQLFLFAFLFAIANPITTLAAPHAITVDRDSITQSFSNLWSTPAFSRVDFTTPVANSRELLSVTAWGSNSVELIYKTNSTPADWGFWQAKFGDAGVTISVVPELLSPPPPTLPNPTDTRYELIDYATSSGSDGTNTCVWLKGSDGKKHTYFLKDFKYEPPKGCEFYLVSDQGKFVSVVHNKAAGSWSITIPARP